MIYLGRGIQQVDEQPRILQLLDGSDVTVSDKELDDLIATFDTFEEWIAWGYDHLKDFSVMSDEPT